MKKLIIGLVACLSVTGPAAVAVGMHVSPSKASASAPPPPVNADGIVTEPAPADVCTKKPDPNDHNDPIRVLYGSIACGNYGAMHH